MLPSEPVWSPADHLAPASWRRGVLTPYLGATHDWRRDIRSPERFGVEIRLYEAPANHAVPSRPDSEPDVGTATSMTTITAYLVHHPRTPSERHKRVYLGERERIAVACVRMALGAGKGAYGYVQRDGVTISYHGASSSLRPVT